VGKSSLVKKYLSQALVTSAPIELHQSLSAISDQWKFTNEYLPTVGIDSFQLPSLCQTTTGEQRLRTMFLDSSGLHEASLIRQEFYTEAHFIIVVFDLTNKKSLDQLQSFISEFQAANINTNDVIVIGNKCENRSLRMNDKDIKRSLGNLKLPTDYIEVSAKTGLNVSMAFDAAIQKALKVLNVGGFQQQSDSNSSNRSAHSNPSASGSRPSTALAVSTKDPISMTTAELQKELETYRIPYVDCVEKSDLINKVLSARAVMNERVELKRKHQQKEDILQEVKQWSLNRDIREMLNEIHKLSLNDPNYLTAAVSFQPVQLSYRRALLKIHPDKHDQTNELEHFRATEMFKAVNSAFEQFKIRNENRAGVDLR